MTATTSPARRPSLPTRRGTADFAAREPGTVAGLAVAAARLRLRHGRRGGDRRPGPRRHSRRPGRRGDAGLGSGPGAADRRADGPQLRLPPLRDRHRHRRLGRRPRRHPGAGPRHAQDPARAARPPEVRRPLRWRGQPPVQPVRHGDGQGQPRDRRRWCGAGSRGGPRGPPRRPGRGRGDGPGPADGAARRRAASASCSTTWTTPRWPRRSSWSDGPGRTDARHWRLRGASPSNAPGRSHDTGVDFISVGALTHSVDVFDIGMDLGTPKAGGT